MTNEISEIAFRQHRNITRAQLLSLGLMGNVLDREVDAYSHGIATVLLTPSG